MSIIGTWGVLKTLCRTLLRVYTVLQTFIKLYPDKHCCKYQLKFPLFSALFPILLLLGECILEIELQWDIHKWHLHSFYRKRNKPLLGTKDRMYHYHRGKSRDGILRSAQWKKKSSIKGTLELFLSYKESHQTGTFEIHSLCSSPLRSSSERIWQAEEGGRKRRNTVSKQASETQFVCLISANPGNAYVRFAQKLQCYRPTKYPLLHCFSS